MVLSRQWHSPMECGDRITGTLKSATSVTGPYSAVAGASSPYSVSPSKAAEFYIAE